VQRNPNATSTSQGGRPAKTAPEVIRYMKDREAKVLSDD
jgi:hypothetical protein